MNKMREAGVGVAWKREIEAETETEMEKGIVNARIACGRHSSPGWT